MMIVLAMAPFVLAPISTEEVTKFSFENDDHRVIVRRVKGTTPFFFQSKMSCDVDGAPNAYNSENDDLALDVIGAAEGRRFGNASSGPLEVMPSADILVYTNGKPYVQTGGEYAGFFVSGTSLYRPGGDPTDTTRYLDSRHTQYIVLPAGLYKDAQLGDLAAVYDPHSHKVAYAVFGDVGPSSECGEASLATLQRLGFGVNDGKSSPAEYRDDMFFVVFPGTSAKFLNAEDWPHPQSTIDRLAASEFQAWGGPGKIEEILANPIGVGSVPDTEENQWIYNEIALAQQRGWIHTAKFSLPERLSNEGGRLPCATELVLASRDAIDSIQAQIEGAERTASISPNENWAFHLRRFTDIIRKFPVAAEEENVSIDQVSAGTNELVSRLHRLAISS